MDRAHRASGVVRSWPRARGRVFDSTGRLLRAVDEPTPTGFLAAARAQEDAVAAMVGPGATPGRWWVPLRLMKNVRTYPDSELARTDWSTPDRELDR